MTDVGGEIIPLFFYALPSTTPQAAVGNLCLLYIGDWLIWIVAHG